MWFSVYSYLIYSILIILLFVLCIAFIHQTINIFLACYLFCYLAIKSTLKQIFNYKASLFFSSTVINSQAAKPQASSGFTLVELIVTVCVLAIVAMIAAPSILSQLAGMESKRIRYGITSMLATAKAESFVRRQNLILCLSNSAGRCNKNSDKAILLFFDNNDNKNFDSATDELLMQQRLAPRYARLQLRAGNRHYIKFWGDSGKPRGFFGHIKYCPTSSYNQAKYQISFNQVGIVKYKPDAAHPTDC